MTFPNLPRTGIQPSLAKAPPSPNGPKSPLTAAAHAPDDLDQLAHVDMVWDQELGLVQDRQLFLTLVALDDHLGVGWGGRMRERCGAWGRGDGRGRRDSPGSCWGAGRGSAAPPYSGRLRTAGGQ